MKNSKTKLIKLVAMTCAIAIFVSVIFVAVSQVANAAINTATLITYDSLKGYVSSYNPDLRIAENSVLKLEKATLDIDKAVSDLVDKYSEVNAKYILAQSDPTTLPATLIELETSLNTIQEQIDAQRKQATTSNNGTRTQAGQAALTFQQKVSVAQQTFLTHYSYIAQIENAQKKLESLNSKAVTAQKRYDLNMLSLAELEAVTDAVEPQKQVISDLNYQIHKTELQLKTLIGVPLSTSITYGPLPTLDFSYIPTINISSDLQKHLVNNQSIKIAEGSLRTTRETSDSLLDVRNAELTLEKTIADATLTFENSYSELNEKLTQLVNNYKALDVKRKDLAKQQVKLEKGLISKNKLKDSQDDLYQAERKHIVDQIALYTLMQNYKISLG